ncbi:MAG: hypothetical protein ACI4S3_05840 [Candidatus Gastranaerophilaceae bacterium]
MFNQFKNLKIVEKLKNIDPKAMLMNFAISQKGNRKAYIDMLTDNREIQTLSDERRLEAMVREQIKMEFPNIESSSSYEILVDAVIHNIKKKQLQATDNYEFE